MPKVMLLLAAGEDSDSPVMRTALAAARLFDGHLQVLHVRPDVRRDIAAMATADMGMTGGLDAMIARLEEDADTQERTSEKACRDFCGANKVGLAESPCPAHVTYEWMVETGNEADWLAELGRVADMLVIGRKRGDDLALDLMEAALMDTGKPILIAPDGNAGALDGGLAIAWKDTPEAAGAVAAALPFIERASKVLIMTVREDPDSDDKSHLRLMRSLRWHNPNVSVQVLPRDERSPSKALLDTVEQAGCGLLVMGGYGHARLREAVFGGFTRAVLEQAKVTVLMVH
jgi:nucleotide-binding universal stress UspA family protein